MTTALEKPREAAGGGPKPMFEGQSGGLEQALIYIFTIVPFVALVAAVPLAWGWGLTWIDIALAAVFFCISGMGVTVGYHRYFTHGSFKAKRGLRVGAGHRRQHVAAGLRDQVGRRPPAPPRLLRP